MMFRLLCSWLSRPWPAEVQRKAASRAAPEQRFVRSCAQPRCRTEKKNVGIRPPCGRRTFDGCVAGLAGKQAGERMFHRIMVLLSEKTKSFWISFHGEAGRSLLLFQTMYLCQRRPRWQRPLNDVWTAHTGPILQRLLKSCFAFAAPEPGAPLLLHATPEHSATSAAPGRKLKKSCERFRKRGQDG